MTLPPLTLIDRPNAHEVALHFTLTADAEAFAGHFPGHPILPGVMQLDWAIGFAAAYLGLPEPSARRFQVKFRQIIGPGEPLTLLLKNDPGRRKLSFTYHVGDQVKASGMIAWGDA